MKEETEERSRDEEISAVLSNTYSLVSNKRSVSNKSVVACRFSTLLHKIARFWSFLATFCLKINRRSATFIRYLRVVL